jgi:hypothetical protein
MECLTQIFCPKGQWSASGGAAMEEGKGGDAKFKRMNYVPYNQWHWHWDQIPQVSV